MPSFKPESTPSFSEFETHERQAKPHGSRLVESFRLSLTSLALLAGITIIGTSGDTLGVYNTTHLGEDFFLPLWPSQFDIRPTIALVSCGGIITVASAASLAVSKVNAIRNKALIHSSVSFLAPIISLIASLVATSFFYGMNASNTVYSLYSWSCQWSAIEMDVAPHWGTLCRESKVALYLMVMIIPVSVLILGCAAAGALKEKKQILENERKGSPAMS